ncbi:MAG TPA: hypothetical protein VHS59_00240 [Bacillota bacterium]|nr:hypothetical protein [Bacillota bacterium]
MEDSQKVLVSKSFLETNHGKQGCVQCHGGSQGNTRAEAHKGIIAKPSKEKADLCEGCHQQAFKGFKNSLHYTNKGIVDVKTGVIGMRANPAKVTTLEKGLKTNCSTCHIQTCGECHITRPATTGGGLVDGHNFYKSPKSVLNCTACHGSRLEKEYMGKAAEDYPELKPDVHWVPNTMQCSTCHKKEWIHNENPPADNRYTVQNGPKCQTCHAEKAGFDAVPSHKKHAIPGNGTLIQCQACHSQSYNNCYGCHVGVDKKNLPFYKTDKSEFNFKIGRNPEKSAARPYDYIIVRHVPVARDTFKFYGDDLLSNFDNSPTWKYSTPHNVQKATPQGQCTGCHGNEKLFLTAKDVLPDEQKANAKVIVSKIPPKM